MESTILSVLKDIGPWGLIGFLYWWDVTKARPAREKLFTDALREERAAYDAVSAQNQKSAQKHTEALDLILDVLRSLTASVRYLTARLASVDPNALEGGEPICPMDGRPCERRKALVEVDPSARADP